MFHVDVAVTRPKPRRTQEERRAETRGKLLDATVRSLREEGYAGTTTRRVAELAGVSQGAQTHYFPRRVDLVGAAVEHLVEQRIAELRRKAARLPSDRVERARAALDLLWADFSSDLFAIVVKLWVAAADDAELYERLVPMERRMARATADAIAFFAGEDGPDPELTARVSVVLAALRGFALSREYEPAARRRASEWRAARPVLERLLLG
jgi:AcrR family transcriptional regulator